MREIEIKVRVQDKKALEDSLRGAGIVLSEPIKQHDVVYGKPGSLDNAPGANWLRIRTENDSKVVFTLKQSVVGHLDSIEHELEVSDAVEMEAIIQLLGFELYSDITKIRQKCKVGDIEICLDEVPGLGTFIEAEKMQQHEADHDGVVAELWQLFTKLNLSKADEVHQGYDVMERAKRNAGPF